MAYEKEPSIEWQEILAIEDETEQTKAATKYVMSLEESVYNLKKLRAEGKTRFQADVVQQVMNCPAFRDWLRGHDNQTIEMYTKDWTGVK